MNTSSYREMLAATDAAKRPALKLSHFIEWADSCVNHEFIAANVRSVEGQEAFDIIAGEKHRIACEKANQAANSNVRYVNKSYRHLYAGGWFVSGVDPLANWEPMAWGQMKPDKPRWNSAKQKAVKYEAPAATPTRLFIPHVPIESARKVLERYNSGVYAHQQLSLTELETACHWGEGGFWGWLIDHPEIPLAIEEGAKKVGASFAAGIAAIGLPGVWNARKPKPKDEEALKHWKAELKDEIVLFAQPGRKIVFAFDADEKPKTQATVWAAMEASAFLILKDTQAQPFFASWHSSQGKGIDDFVASNGADAFAAVINAARDYEEWKIQCQLSGELTRSPDLLINQKLIDIDLDALPKEGIIAIVSPKGSGKTQRFLKPLVEGEDSALLIGHLINLTKANSQRMSCTYRSDLDRAAGRFLNADGEVVYRVSTVIDSLMSFNPKDFEGAAIVLDEVCQLLRSALTSRNISKRGNRGAILTRLREILQRARRVIVADADLDDATLRYLEDLRGERKTAFLVKNIYQPEGYDVTFYEATAPSGIISDALDIYKAELAKGQSGKHIAIACDSQAKAKVIAEMARQIKGAQVLEIHSDTSGGELESEFIRNPDQYLSYQDVPLLLIYSPSLGTGVSIESPNIARVFGIFQGASIVDTDILQMLGRVRCNCPRSVWVSQRGTAYSRLGRSQSAATLKEELRIMATVTASSIRCELTETAYSGLTSFDWESDPHIQSFCHIESLRNRAMPNLRARVAYRLKAEGNRITMRNEWDSLPTALAMKATREELAQAEAKAVASRDDIDEVTAALLAAKEAPTIEERQSLSKYHLADFYCAEVTAQLILDDKKGRTRSEAKSFEELMNKDLAVKRDVAAIEAQLKWGDTLMPQDVRSGALAAEVRLLLGLDKWIAREDSWASNSQELIDFKELCLRERVSLSIKRALGYTVKPDATPQQILGDLLRQVGVRTENKQKRVDGELVRIYEIDSQKLNELKSLVERREEKRSEAAQAIDYSEINEDFRCNTPPLLNKKPEGGVTPTGKDQRTEDGETLRKRSDEGAGAQLAIAGTTPKVFDDDFYDESAWRKHR